jgi:hypothetical protein
MRSALWVGFVVTIALWLRLCLRLTTRTNEPGLEGQLLQGWLFGVQPLLALPVLIFAKSSRKRDARLRGFAVCSTGDPKEA